MKGYRGFPSKEAYEDYYSDPAKYACEIPAMEEYVREAEQERKDRTTRDARGWRVPRPGTHSRYIYDAMYAEVKCCNMTIAHALGISPSTVGVLKYKIRNPERANARELAQYHLAAKKGPVPC